MRVTFWGVRGCIPAPGPDTNRYGGNTACVQVVTQRGDIIILDAGTGITGLGSHLLAGPFGRGRGRAHLFITHAHWDHIQGFPFFAPVYIPGNRFDIYGQGGASGRLEDILEGQMSPHFNPVQSLRNLGADIAFHELRPGEEVLLGPTRVTTTELPHGTTTILAFRIEDHGRSLVYVPDVSYLAPEDFRRATAFYAGCHCLIHDATYSDEDWTPRKERGFSSVRQAVEAALAANAAQLVLVHYDQDYDDETVDRLLATARRRAQQAGARLRVLAAQEGLTLSC